MGYAVSEQGHVLNVVSMGIFTESALNRRVLRLQRQDLPSRQYRWTEGTQVDQLAEDRAEFIQ